MPRGDDADAVRGLLRDELIARLEPAGWRAVDGRRRGLVGLVRPGGDGLEATASVDLVHAYPDRLPVLVSDVYVGVGYGPLRELWPLLGDQFALALLAASTRWVTDDPAGDPGNDADGDEVEDDDDDDPGPDADALLTVSAASEVSGAVDTLAALILDRASPFADRYPSLDSLVGALADDEHPDDLRLPALLAAAGRFPPAAAALDRHRAPVASDRLSRRERRTAYQLRRWIDSGGDRSLLPAEAPPCWDAPRTRRTFAQTRSDDRARREALDEVRQAGRGRPRDEVRGLLESAFARRGLTDSPLSMEMTLDHLWDTPADRLRLGVQGLKALGRFGRGVVRAIREHELPDVATPPWLEPPDPAFYELPHSDRWCLAALDPGADGWLARVHESAPVRLFGVTSVDAWLKPAPGDGHPPALEVHIGAHRVGVVTEAAVPDYLPWMEAAGFRAELPSLSARLARRGDPPGYLLELVVPPAPPGEASAPGARCAKLLPP